MRVFLGRPGALVALLVSIASFAAFAIRAEAQLQGFGAGTNLFSDEDSSGDVSCGDILTTRVIIGSHIGAQDLTNLSLSWPVPTGTTLVPGSATIGIGEESECTLVAGDDAADREVRAECSFVCRTGGGGGEPGTCEQVGIDLQAFLVIDEPNVADSVRLIATAVADQFSPVQTFSNELTFTPCPPAAPPILQATLVDQGANDADADGAVDPGEAIVYALRVENLGQSAADQVVVQVPPPVDTVLEPRSVVAPPGATVVRGNGTSDATVEVLIPRLAARGSAQIRFSVLVDAPLTPGTVVSAQGAISARNAAPTVSDDPQTPALHDPTTTPIDHDVDVRLSLSASPPAAGAGERITWQLGVLNAGPVAAVGVRVATTVPPHTTFDAAVSDSRWTCGGTAAGSSCVASLGTMLPGGRQEVRFGTRVVGRLGAGATDTTLSASVAVDGPDLNPGNNQAQATAKLVGEPALRLAKSGPATARPGEVLAFELAYANEGDREAVGVVLSETVPAGTAFVAPASSPGWSCADGGRAGTECRLALGALAASQGGSRTFAVRLGSPVPADVTSVVNVATLREDGGSPPDTDSHETPIEASPRLSLEKSAPAEAGPGELVVYTLALGNTGDRDATDVVLAETVPLHSSFAAAESTAGWSCADGASAGERCELAVGDLAAGAAPRKVSFAVRVAAALPAAADELVNLAEARAPGASPTGARAATRLVASPRLVLVKSGPEVARPGELVVYRLAYANEGGREAVGVELVDEIPAFATFDEAASTAGFSCTASSLGSSTCTFPIGALAAGEGGEVTVALRLAPSVPAGLAELVNVALLRDGSGAPPAGARAATPIEASPALRLTKSGPASARPGQLLVYILALANEGDRDAVDVAVVETVPAHTTFSDEGSSPGWSCDDGASAGTSCTLLVGDLAAGAAAAVDFAVVVGAPPAEVTSIRNTALVTDGGGSPPGDDDVETPIEGAAVLALEKTGPSVARPGQAVHYRLAFRNVGDRLAAGVVLEETVPAETTFASEASSPGWSCLGVVAGSLCRLEVGELRAGETREAVFAVVVADPLPPNVAQLVNTALLRETGGSPPVEAKAVTPVDAGVVVGERVFARLVDSIVEDDGDGLIGAGDVIGYTLTVEAIEPVADVVARVPPDPATELVVGRVGTSLGSVLSGQEAGDSMPAVALGDLAAGQTATVTFEVVIVEPVPEGVGFVAAQADLLSVGESLTISDDPDTTEPLDPTVTDLDMAVEAIAEIPTLDHVGLAILVLVLVGAGFIRLRRPRVA